MDSTHAEGLDLSTVRVLILDDRADCRELLRFVLEAHGASVSAVDSVFEAELDVEDFLPDVIVSDIMLPESSGFEFLEKLREAGSRAPAIAVTAADNEKNRARALTSGFQAFLGKPFAVGRFVTLVQALSMAPLPPTTRQPAKLWG